MAYELALTVGSASLVVSGVAIALHRMNYYRRIISPITRSFEDNLASLDRIVEDHVGLRNIPKDRIMTEVTVSSITDSTIGLHIGLGPRPIGEVYSEIREAFDKWSGFSRREKINRATQRPYMPTPGVGIQITA